LRSNTEIASAKTLYLSSALQKEIHKEKSIGAGFKKAVKNWFLPKYIEFHSQQMCVL
jgi:hypothetical protein